MTHKLHKQIRDLLQSEQLPDMETQLRIDDHLDGCEQCRAYARMLAELAAGEWGLQRPKVLSSAEIYTLQRQIAAHKRKPIGWLPTFNIQSVGFAVGMTSLFFIALLGWQLLQFGGGQTPIDETHLQTLTATREPTATPTLPQPTATKTARPTIAPTQVTRIAEVQPLATTVPVPTATVSLFVEEPLLPTIAPTEIATRVPTTVVLAATPLPTVTDIPQVASALEAVDQLMAALNSGSAEALRPLFADQVLYAVTGHGFTQYSTANLVPELQLLQIGASQFSVTGCTVVPGTGGGTRRNCTLSMQNQWRRALQLDVYQSALRLDVDAAGKISTLTDFQYNEQSVADRAIVQKFINWYNLNNPEQAPLEIFKHADPRLFRVPGLLEMAESWVAQGMP